MYELLVTYSTEGASLMEAIKSAYTVSVTGFTTSSAECQAQAQSLLMIVTKDPAYTDVSSIVNGFGRLIISATTQGLDGIAQCVYKG